MFFGFLRNMEGDLFASSFMKPLLSDLVSVSLAVFRDKCIPSSVFW